MPKRTTNDPKPRESRHGCAEAIEPLPIPPDPAEDRHIVLDAVSVGYGETVIQRDLSFGSVAAMSSSSWAAAAAARAPSCAVWSDSWRPRPGESCSTARAFGTPPARAHPTDASQRCHVSERRPVELHDTRGERRLAARAIHAADRAEIHEIAVYKLALVGLSAYCDYYPSEISGGMRKRVGVARAMALDPDILFFDEPSAGLDPLSARLLDDLILELRESLGTTMVVVTHDLASIFAIADDSVFLDAATQTMLTTGNPRDLREHSEIKIVRDFLSRGGHEQTGQSDRDRRLRARGLGPGRDRDPGVRQRCALSRAGADGDLFPGRCRG
jgi:phospholipid/cholesterol/gamma-HCH transport system ATP-binding protein